MGSYTAKITEGCVAFDFSVDDQSWSCEDKRYEFKEKDKFREALAIFVFEKIKSGEIDTQELIRLLKCDNYDSDDSTCDQCGDSVCWEIWKIPNNKKDNKNEK